MEAVLRYHGASDGDDLNAEGCIGVVRGLVAGAIPVAAAEIDSVANFILPEFDHYGELIAAIDEPVVGLLVRGEGEDFTGRVSALMDLWQMTDEAKRYHIYLAEAFEHKRAFLKLEWREVAGKLERQIAVYYRRRPYVHDALKSLANFAGKSLSLDGFRELGGLLGKDTVHFVAFTARPDRPLWYKCYFSQYLTPDRFHGVEMRLQRAVEWFAGAGPAVSRWATYHDRLAPRYRTETIFVSLALSEDGSDGSLKIDYPDVSPLTASALLDGSAAAHAAERLRWLCDAAERPTLSYLGVRIGGADHLVLKGYADCL
ncbi:MAG TPA: hypothetical protein VF208_02465 [Candidatus Binatia bacterium]